VNELFADPEFPVFGFGGVAIMAGAIQQTISVPWRKMKAEHFGGADVALHAADLRAPTAAQIEALTEFFKFQEFGRFAVTLTSKSTVPGHLALHNVVSAAIKKRWEELATRMNPMPTEVAFFFEASQCTDELIQRYFSPIHVTIQQNVVPAHYGLIDKSSGDPALEVADFIIHTAGRQAFNWSKGDGLSSRLPRYFSRQPALEQLSCDKRGYSLKFGQALTATPEIGSASEPRPLSRARRGVGSPRNN
jgi:hypothetical protein